MIVCLPLTKQLQSCIFQVTEKVASINTFYLVRAIIFTEKLKTNKKIDLLPWTRVGLCTQNLAIMKISSNDDDCRSTRVCRYLRQVLQNRNSTVLSMLQLLYMTYSYPTELMS